MKNYLFCSIYYKNKLQSGANKRFKNLLFEFHNQLSNEQILIIIVKKGHAPVFLTESSKNIIIHEIPFFRIFDRFFSFLYLSIILSKMSKMIVISDFMPVPVYALRKHIHFQLVHDLRNFNIYKDSLLRIKWRIQKLQWQQCQQILTVSNFSKKELIKYCKINPKKIFVSPNGIEKAYFGTKYSIKDEFDLLYIANFEKRKNHSLLLRALSKINIQIRVCFVGSDSAQKSKIQTLSHSLSGVDFTFMESNLNEEKLIELYDKSKIYVCPSLYEGFCMPLLEAMSRNCKLICYNIDIFREVCGNNANYFNNEEELAELINRELLELKGRQDIPEMDKRHSWEYIANTFINYINDNY
jgi:glycosyltransferase involved in cell wall biosynthesis